MRSATRQLVRPAASALATLVMGLGLALPVQAADALWWRQPASPEITWRGMLPTEGGAVGMGPQIGLYPAFGLGGLVAAIFTHAAITTSVQSAERKREQDAADKVLEPYAADLKAWSAQALWGAALAASGKPGETAAWQTWDGSGTQPGPVLETVPVFTLAQDEGVLVLDLAVRQTAAAGAAPQERVLRVVSSPHDSADARRHWSEDGAARLKSTAAQMLAHALQMTQQMGAVPPESTAGAEAPPMRTHRYLQGSVERTERAQQVGGDCSRAVLRNLRGWLMSVPLKPAEGGLCERRTPF